MNPALDSHLSHSTPSDNMAFTAQLARRRYYAAQREIRRGTGLPSHLRSLRFWRDLYNFAQAKLSHCPACQGRKHTTRYVPVWDYHLSEPCSTCSGTGAVHSSR